MNKEKPDWVDIILAATLVSWGTVLSAMTVALFAQVQGELNTAYVTRFMVSWAAMAFAGFFVTLFICIILGLPALAIARLLRLDRPWQAAALGALAGALVALAIPKPSGFAYDWVEIAGALVFVLAGALAGLAAWRERNKGNLTA